MKSYGLLPDVYNPEDYKFGSGQIPMEVLQENGDWTSYLPAKEYQNLNGIEPYACVTFTILNCIEILIRKQYGVETNWSDRFLSAISGTKEKQGNSPNVVAQSLRDKGVVLQDVWPLNQSINSFEKYYENIPPALLELAKEFNNEWDFRYDNVLVNHLAIASALQASPLLFTVTAWFERNGKYYNPGMPNNHATTLIYAHPDDFYRVFDSYADGEGDPALKDVEWEAIPMTVKRFWIKKKAEVKEEISLLKRIFNVILQLIGLQYPKVKNDLPKPFDLPEPNPILPVIHVSRIEDWARAITVEEGGKPTDRNMRNHNPLNLKWTTYTQSLGAINRDVDNFCIFRDYAAGFLAGCQFLKDAANDKLKPYHDKTLQEFTTIFAQPPDDGYSRRVALKLKVALETKIKTLL